MGWSRLGLVTSVGISEVGLSHVLRIPMGSLELFGQIMVSLVSKSLTLIPRTLLGRATCSFQVPEVPKIVNVISSIAL